MRQWWSNPRFRDTKRPYTAEEAVSMRGTLPETFASNEMAKKLWAVFEKARATGGYSHTFGALDPVQVIEMAPHLQSVYVSGWQCSSTASSSNEPGPDFADYPMDTVPRQQCAQCSCTVLGFRSYILLLRAESGSALPCSAPPGPPPGQFTAHTYLKRLLTNCLCCSASSRRATPITCFHVSAALPGVAMVPQLYSTALAAADSSLALVVSATQHRGRRG
eukprot:2141-Heterococcus_DN1.PRE.1